MNDDDYIPCLRGKNEDGWSFEMYLHRGRPSGELRFALHGEPKFTQEMGVNEIAIFMALRMDLMADYITSLIRAHRPH